MAGLLDLFSNPDSRLAIGLLSAAGPSREPLSFGQRMGGLMAQLDQQKRLEAEDAARKEERALKARMMGLQEQQILQQLAAQKQAQEEAQQRQRYLGSVDQSQGPAMPVSMAGGMAAGLAPQEVAALMPPPTKEEKPVILKPGEVAFGSGGKQLFSVPEKADKAPEALRTLALIYGEGSPEYMQAARSLAQKMTTHQPAVQNINYGTPMPAINPATGKVELVRPDNKGGMSFTGVEPPPQNRDTKLPAEIQRMNIAADSMVSLLGDYEKWLAKNNPRDPTVQMSPARRAEMQSLMKNIQLQYKELAALGALAGPDLALMEAALTDPFTFKGAWYGPSGLRSQITQARNLVDVRRKAIGSNSGGQQQAQPADDDPLGLRK